MNWKNFVLGAAIFVVAMFVVIYGIDVFYHEPTYEDFCGEYDSKIIDTETECLQEGGIWDSYEDIPNSLGEPTLAGYCDLYYTCGQEYDTAYEQYQKNVFFIEFPLGIIIIVAGLLLFSVDAVGIGLMLSGLGIIIRGTWTYWEYADSWVRFLISLVGLIGLILVTYYFNKKIGKKRKR